MIYLSKIQSGSIGLSVMHMFVLDKSAILMVDPPYIYIFHTYTIC